MSEKIISIIIPCYNVDNYIDRCFNSLKNQTLGIEKMELIFVNDASTDNTIDHLRRFETQYPEDVLLIDLEKNVGQGAARNVGMQYASCEYIGFVDSDDMIEPDMYDRMLKVAVENQCDVVECTWDFFSQQSKEFSDPQLNRTHFGRIDFTKEMDRCDYIVDNLFFTSVCTRLFNRQLLLKNDIRFPEGLKYEDCYFCFLCFFYAKSYYHMEDSFYHYFLNPKGTVQQRNSEHQFDRMDIAILFLETCKERGLTNDNKDIIEWMFLEVFYVYMIWDVWDNFRQNAYECFLMMRDNIPRLIPDYRENPYRKLEINHMDDVLLKLLDYPLSEKDFAELMNQLWTNQRGV